MKPSEIRRELLRQHAEIRVIMDVTLTITNGVRAGTGRGDVHASLIRLADAFSTHNSREEALLRELIPSVDAWGPVRAEIMIEEHVQEHARIRAALLGIPFMPIEFAVAGIVALIELIRQHMDREEATFLGDDVLHDDVVVQNQTGG